MLTAGTGLGAGRGGFRQVEAPGRMDPNVRAHDLRSAARAPDGIEAGKFERDGKFLKLKGLSSAEFQAWFKNMEFSRVWSLNKRTEEVHRYVCIHFGKPRPSEVVGKKPKTRGPPREPSMACQCGAAFSISCERPARGGHKACRLQLPTSGGPSLLEFAQQHKKSLWTIRSKKLEHNPRCAKLLAGPARCLHKAGRQTLLRLVQANPSAQVGEIQKKIRAIATCAEADKA